MLSRWEDIDIFKGLLAGTLADLSSHLLEISVNHETEHPPFVLYEKRILTSPETFSGPGKLFVVKMTGHCNFRDVFPRVDYLTMDRKNVFYVKDVEFVYFTVLALTKSKSKTSCGHYQIQVPDTLIWVDPSVARTPVSVIGQTMVNINDERFCAHVTTQREFNFLFDLVTGF